MNPQKHSEDRVGPCGSGRRVGRAGVFNDDAIYAAVGKKVMDLFDLSPNELKVAMQPGLQLLRQWAAGRGIPTDGQEMTALRDAFEQRLVFAMEETDAKLLSPQWSWTRAIGMLSVYTAQALMEEHDQ